MNTEERTISPEEIKRVKGLGFLHDKRYPDIFNARIITRNGKPTAARLRFAYINDKLLNS